MPVPQSVLEDLLRHFTTEKNLRISGRGSRNLDQHRAFFVWRRAALLGNRHPAWVTDVDQTTLKGRIDSEYQAVEAFVADTLGSLQNPGPLLPVLGGTGDVSPNHLDLKDLARQRTSEPANSVAVRGRARENTRLRYLRGQWIIWRAAALHDEVWQPSPDSRTATLRFDSLVVLNPVGPITEYLDRRLRAIERMHFNIADTSRGFGGMGTRRWNTTGATGPWKDSFRVRILEYPRMPKFLAKLRIGVDNVAPAGTSGLLPPPHDATGHASHPGTEPHWVWSEDNKRIEWRVAPSVGATHAWRLPPSIRGNWRAHAARPYRIDLVPASGTGAEAVDTLFAYPKEDVWGRAWIWCDHAIAACDIEALLFGLRRRYSSGESTFNDLASGTGLPSGGVSPYVAMTPVIGTMAGVASDHLMAHANDRHFENMLIEDADLQVGDHLIFWNHVLYNLISTGSWRLENALVMRVDSDPKGEIRRQSIMLQGHGTNIRSYPRYQDLIAKKLRPAMHLIRKKIRQEVTADSTIDTIPWRRTRLVKWSPYDNFRRVRYPKHGVLNLGAWWMEIPLSMTLWTSVDDAVKGLPKAVGHGVGRLASPGAGYTPPPDPGLTAVPPGPTAVYFPIFEPRITVMAGGNQLHGWEAFFERRRTTAIPPQLLDVVSVDGKLIPGLYRRGDRQFPIVRAKATP